MTGTHAEERVVTPVESVKEAEEPQSEEKEKQEEERGPAPRSESEVDVATSTGAEATGEYSDDLRVGKRLDERVEVFSIPDIVL
jgi:hypothetical protein